MGKSSNVMYSCRFWKRYDEYCDISDDCDNTTKETNAHLGKRKMKNAKSACYGRFNLV